MVAGGADIDAAVADTELLAQIRRLAADARRVTSVCSGAFLLAAAGLLDGRRATTHWAECGLLDDTYADVTVDPDAIYVNDGNVWTSAGVTAGIDLALALVADDHGHQAAATVARQLVVYLQRSGGQAQFSALLAGQAADTEPVRDLLSWLRDHLTDDLSVAALARQINLSERQFTRVFKAEVGATAADHVEAVRLESACRLLETTNRTIEQIAKTCGFGTPETMNRTFRRRLNTTPGEHRHHFRGDSRCQLVPRKPGTARDLVPRSAHVRLAQDQMARKAQAYGPRTSTQRDSDPVALNRGTNIVHDAHSTAFGTKRSQVQILSPRQEFQVNGLITDTTSTLLII